MIARIVEDLPRFLGYWNLLFLLQAMATTLFLSAVGCVAGVALGFLAAALRRHPSRALLPLKVLIVAYVEAFRRIPFLVTLMLVFFAFQLNKIDVPMFVVALVSVGLIAAAFIAEIVRSGLDSVHRNQWDAAATLNMGYAQTLRLVVMPQAWKVVLPPAFSFFVLFIKDTALASQIGVVELTYAGKVLNDKGFAAALTFGTILLLYFALSYPLTRLGRTLERRLAASRRR
ncbi:MAG: amino acid ABC transporter permease [Alphaproteobacteria bacterium]|nr:amino acid ABC transporter permease [Alphaproteobacteria bacterium]